MNEEFSKDLAYLSSREELELDLGELEGYLEDESPTAPVIPIRSSEPIETLKASTMSAPDSPSPKEMKSQAAFLKLADFIKSELKNIVPENPEAAKTMKVIALYEKRTVHAQSKQKGLQLKKVA